METTNLKKLREQRGFTQADLAEISGVSIRMIQKYEQRDRDINKVQAITLYMLAKAMECSIENLLELGNQEEA